MSMPTSIERPETHSLVFGYCLWLLGFSGLHRFYYGKPLTGALWFITLGLAGIGWLVDVVLVSGMNREANQRFVPGRYDYNIAWALLLIFSVFGLHRLYLGKVISFLLFLVTAGLFGLGVIYDVCTLNDQISELNAQPFTE